VTFDTEEHHILLTAVARTTPYQELSRFYCYCSQPRSPQNHEATALIQRLSVAPHTPHPDTPRHAVVDNSRNGDRSGKGASCRGSAVHWRRDKLALQKREDLGESVPRPPLFMSLPRTLPAHGRSRTGGGGEVSAGSAAASRPEVAKGGGGFSVLLLSCLLSPTGAALTPWSRTKPNRSGGKVIAKGFMSSGGFHWWPDRLSASAHWFIVTISFYSRGRCYLLHFVAPSTFDKSHLQRCLNRRFLRNGGACECTRGPEI